jgi:hypothetical protein
MNSSVLSRAVPVVALLLVAGSIGLLAEPRTPTHFSGVINDYTPAAAVGSASPWEVRGPWNLRLDEDGKADFSAEVTMELSNPSDPNNPSTRMQHTHHLSVEDGTVTSITGGFEVTGSVTITKDGGPAPAAIQGSTLVIDVTGGTLVDFSNITLTFQGGATKHFGSQPIHGVVR